MKWHNRSRRQASRILSLFVEALEGRQLLSAGQLDPSFSGDGHATADFKNDFSANGVATQSDGKTVVVGDVGPDDIGLARYNFDGSLDTHFGTAGTGMIQLHPVGKFFDQAVAVAIQGDGKIVVAGDDGDGNTLVFRFLSNGQFDHTFDGDGIASVSYGTFDGASAVTALAIQNDGKIIVVGQAGFSTQSFAIARLNTNGSPDTTFGDVVLRNHKATRTGRTTVNLGDGAVAEAVTLDYSGTQSSNPFFGTIVVSGFTQVGQQNRFAVVRLRSNGSPDSRFDKDGVVSLTLPNTSSAISTGVVIQPTGKIVLSGIMSSTGSDEVFAVSRLTPTGALDTSFGGSGIGWKLIGFGGNDEADQITVGLNNRLFVAGNAGGQIAIAALTEDGSLDSSFGSDGKVTTSISGKQTVAPEVAVAYLGDRVVAVAGGSLLNINRYLDVNPAVAATAILTTASEQGPTPVTFIVSRDQRLPFDTDVLFSIGGTATAPSSFALKNGSADYTLSGLTIPQFVSIGHSATPFVDIPAGQTFVLVTLTPVKDNTPEPTEAATFTIIANASYTIDTPSSATINIQDNNISASTTLKTTADSYVQDGSAAGTNFGSSALLEVKKSGTGFNRVTYLKFDLSSVSSINSAKLELFGNLSDTQDASITTSLFSVADTSWTESGINFNNAPALGSTALDTETITGTGGKTYTFDVTSYLQAQKAAGHNIVSLALKDSATSNSFIKFNSKEAGSNPPMLLIGTSASGVVGTFKLASPHTTPAGQPTNVAVTWQVPSGSWQQLHTIDLQLSADNGALIDIRWNQQNETFALLDPQTGEFGTPQALGSDKVLSNKLVNVLLKSSSKLSSGPTSPIVKVTFSLQFTQAAVGHHFSVEVAANNDSGSKTTFGLGKSITVT